MVHDSFIFIPIPYCTIEDIETDIHSLVVRKQVLSSNIPRTVHIQQRCRTLHSNITPLKINLN